MKEDNYPEIFNWYIVQGQLLQMTMMTPPSINSELYYLNKEDRLLRWLLIKHRDFKFRGSSMGEVDIASELRDVKSVLNDGNMIEEEEDDNDDDDGDEQSESGDSMS